MTLERFAELVASYGADPERWPNNNGKDERREGADLITSNPEAEKIVSQAAALDELLDSLSRPEPAGAALIDRLEAVSMQPQENKAGNIAPTQPTGQRGPSIFWVLFGNAARRSLIPQAAGLTMICLVGGVALGLSNFAGPPESTVLVDPTAYFFGDPGLEKDLEEMD